MTAPVTAERIAWLRGRHERDDWGGPAKDERSSLSVGEVRDLLLALDAAQAELAESRAASNSAHLELEDAITNERAVAAARDAAVAESARLREALTWAESRLSVLVTETDYGVFIGGLELVGFGEGLKNIRAAIAADPSTPKEPR